MRKKLEKYNKVRGLPFYLWVGAVWLVLWIFNASMNNETFVPQSLNEIWRVLYLVVANFIFFEYSLPFILKRRSLILLNILNGILIIGMQFMIVSLGLFGWKYLGVYLRIYTSLRQSSLIPDGNYNQFIEEVSYQAEGGVTSVLFFGIAKLFHHNFILRQTTQKLRLEKQEAELNYLKSQTNPHFLFNTLNNIYSLTRDKSDLAPESILRLSQILRFMLYETREMYICVKQEMEIITDYIALEEMRYDDSLSVNFTSDIEDVNQTLPPLLLVPLVENAFKHGVSETRNAPFLDIYLSIIRHQLLFEVKNSAENFNGNKNVKENIGLSNLRRQLELLYSDYTLTVKHNENVFTVVLKINLKSHV